MSVETLRRWVPEVGWVGKRATLVAKDAAPRRVDRLARIRYVVEQLKPWEAMVCADELDIHLWPTVGGAWRPKGTPREVMRPGHNQKHYWAGALELTTGRLHHCLGPRKTTTLFRDRLPGLEARYAAERYTQLSGVVDHDTIHQAKAVADWLTAQPRLTRLLLPTDGPRANPIERAFGNGQACCTRNHHRTRLPDLVTEVEDHLHLNGPWKYQLSERY